MTVTSDKSKTVATLLCLFGGIIGLHRYYVGRIGGGLLFTCTAGLFIFGWISDLIKCFTGSLKDNAGARYENDYEKVVCFRY